MKKIKVLKVFSLLLSFTVILSSCSFNTLTKNDEDFDIEKEEYLIRFTLTGPMLYKKYMFVLTPENEILAEYVNENNKIKKTRFSLNERQWKQLKDYADTVLTLDKEDIEGYYYVTDVWYAIIEFDNVQASFDYGASKSTEVNILLEQIIGCCDSEKSLKTEENLVYFDYDRISYKRSIMKTLESQKDDDE